MVEEIIDLRKACENNIVASHRVHMSPNFLSCIITIHGDIHKRIPVYRNVNALENVPIRSLCKIVHLLHVSIIYLEIQERKKRNVTS